jgi:nifR3 family TIM-barrel protein
MTKNVAVLNSSNQGILMKLGNLLLKNNVFLAPMAGITNLPFRSLVRRFGCGMAFTEMISANGLFRAAGKSQLYLDSAPDDKPLGVQIFGSDPAALATAAKIVSDRGADLLDVNMGCPVKKVVKTGAGAALMRDPLRVNLILRSVRESTSLPLTIKIRSGWNPREIRAVEIARIAEDCGVDAVIIHPRTADQGFSGEADWRIIEAVKKTIHIPVIGSGDVRSPEDAFRMIAATGCDGIMLGRAVLGNPWIFRDIISFLNHRDVFSPLSLFEKEKVIRDHMNMEIMYYGEYLGVRNFRKHLLWYTKGMRNSCQFRQRLGLIRDKDLMLRELGDFFHSHEYVTTEN